MNLMQIKVSLRSLRKNLSALRKKKGLKAAAAAAKTERKIEKLIAKMAECGLSEKDVKFKRKAERHKSNYGEYRTYLSSSEWAARRKAYYELHHKKCRSCGKKDGEIHLHHKTYKRLKNEDNSDLMPLCSVCHEILHFVQKAFQLSVEEATECWVGSTNNTAQKKANREILRSLTLKKFKQTWRGLKVRHEDAAGLITAILSSLANQCVNAVEITPKVEKEMAFARRVGNPVAYDRAVDAMMKRAAAKMKTP